MNNEKFVVLAQAAEKENDEAYGIPVGEILRSDPEWQREIGNLVINISLLKQKCKEGLGMTQNIINHPNYNKHDFKLAKFVHMWQHIIQSIQDYERRLDKYFSPVKSTEFTAMSATYERRLRKLLKDIEEKIEEVSTSASILQDISDKVNLGENFHLNYGDLNKLKNDIKEFIRVLKDKDFVALEETVALRSVKSNKLVSAQFSTQVPFLNQFDTDKDVDIDKLWENLEDLKTETDETTTPSEPEDDEAIRAEFQASLQSAFKHVQTQVANLKLENEDMRTMVQNYIVDPLNEFFQHHLGTGDIISFSNLDFPNYITAGTGGFTESSVRALSPEELDSLNNSLININAALGQISGKYEPMGLLEDKKFEWTSALTNTQMLLSIVAPIKEEIDASRSEDKEINKPSFDSIIAKYKALQTNYPITEVAKASVKYGELLLSIYGGLEIAIDEMVKEVSGESVASLHNIIKTAQEIDLQGFMSDMLDILNDIYMVSDETHPDGYEMKAGVLSMIQDLQSVINKYEESIATTTPEEQKEVWTNINSHLITIYNGLDALKDTLPKTDLTTINNGSQRYTQDIIDEIEEYQGAAQSIRDIGEEIRIPGRADTFSGMDRDNILGTIKGYVLEIASELPKTAEWDTGVLENTWDALARGIEKISNELRTSDATEYELTPAEFLKASEILNDFLANEGNTLQEVTQQRTAMEPVFTNLNTMIQAVHNLAQTEADPHNLNKNNKNFGEMIGNLNNAGTQMQEAYNKLLALEKTYTNALQQLQNIRTQRDVGASEDSRMYVKSQGFGRQINDFWRGLTGKTISQKDVNNFISTHAVPLVEGFKTYEQSLHQEVENIYKQILEITNQDSNHSLSLLAYNLFPTNAYQNMPQQTVETETTTTVDPRKGPSSKTTTKTVDTPDFDQFIKFLEGIPKGTSLDDVIKHLKSL